MSGLVLLFGLLVIPRAAATAQDRPLATPCHTYAPDTVELSGHLQLRVYPGRPNYESIAAGDAADTVLVLQLLQPLCVTKSERYEEHSGVREVQLLLDDAFANVRPQLGTRITVRGALQGADWGWHHLDVLLRGRLVRSTQRRAALDSQRQVRHNVRCNCQALQALRLSAWTALLPANRLPHVEATACS